MPSIQKVRDWYAQSFEVSRLCYWLQMNTALTIATGNHTVTEAQLDVRGSRALSEAHERERIWIKDLERDFEEP